MILNRHWIVAIFAGCCCRLALAQETGAGSSGTGASSSFGSGVFSSGGSTGATPSGGRSFSLFGSGEAAAAPVTRTQAPAQYTLPGFYGQGSQTLTAGEGLLARPRFESTVSLSMGYDDNYNQGSGGSNFLSVLNGVDLVGGVQGGQPIIEERDVILASGIVEKRQVIVGFTDGVAPTQVPRFTIIPPEKRQGSLVTRANFGFDMHVAAHRSLLTFALRGGTTYYLDKDKDPFENTGSISANYLYRITPRLQFTGQLNSSYITQPDLSRANTPNRPTRGPFISTLSRADLSYRFTPRFSLTGSLTYNTLSYTEKLEETGNYGESVVGVEARYLWNPRYTFLTEYRHSMIGYANTPARDSTTDSLLLGTEFTINRRLTGSLRVGGSIRSFDTGGSSSLKPHVESALTYRTTARSLLQWTNRFGFEEPSAPGEERLVLRSGITYSYSFTPRLRGSLAVNLLHETTTSTSSNTDSSQNTFDSSFALDYTVSQDFSLNLNYSFTDVVTNQNDFSYYRNRVFIGGDYHF